MRELVEARAATNVPSGVLFVVVTAILVGFVSLLPRWWAAPRTRPIPRPAHRERTRVPVALLLLAALAGNGFAALTSHHVLGPTTGFVIGRFFLGLAALAAISAVSTYWFNQPKFLVPPRLRPDPGKWQENRRRR